MKKGILHILISVAILAFTGCQAIGNSGGAEGGAEDFPVIVNQVRFEEPVKTVVSLSPSVTEILCELGLNDMIVGKTSYCNFPESIDATEVGSPANPDIKAILQIAPELLIYQSPISAGELKELEEKGIKTLRIEFPSTLSDLTDMYAKIAMPFKGAVGSITASSDAFAPVTSVLEDISQSMVNSSFIYFVSEDLKVATGDTLAGNILSIFGENVADEQESYVMSVEDIVKANPEVIFVSNEVDKDELPDEIKALDAYKNDNIHTLEGIYFERPSSRMSEEISKAFDFLNKQQPETSDTSNEEQTE